MDSRTEATVDKPLQPLDQVIRLDRSSPVPLYFQVAQRLQDLIESGEIPTGSMLDNEVVIASQLGLARPTIRQAMQYLVDKGYLARKRGVGTTVIHNRVRRKVEMTSLYEDLEHAGRRPSTEVLEFEVVPAPPEVATALALEVGADVLSLRRLRFAGDEPLAILRNHVLCDLGVTESGLKRQGLYQLLRTKGTEIRSADQTVSARRATAAEADLLAQPRGATLLTVNRTAYDQSGRPVEFGRDLYSAALYSIDISVARD